MSLRSVFQPIVDLPARRVVGYEALTRGAQGAAPLDLFAAARAAGSPVALDWECRTAAIDAALAHPGFARPRRLFLNAEPEALAAPVPTAAVPGWARAQEELDIVLEVTERALAAAPAALLAAVDQARDRGWGIALDDVGADMRTLALLPLVRPDVIKLDLSVIQQRPSAEVAAVATAVSIEQEHTGAVVLAEGVETEEHLQTALALNATLGQGWLFGHPEPLPAMLPAPGPPVRLLERRPSPRAASPFELLSAHAPVQVARKRLLLAITEHLERQAVALGAGALVIGTFEHGRFFRGPTVGRYEQLAGSAGFVAAMGEGLDAEPAVGVRGGIVPHADDPIAGQWNVVVLGHHFGAVLSAVDHGDDDDGPALDRRFRFVLTHDRGLAIETARLLMRRVRSTRVRAAELRAA